MNKIYILMLSLMLFSSCTSKAEMEAKAKHQAQSGDRINQSQQNTDSLFKEMDKQ